MKSLTALSLSISVLGGLATFLAVGPASGFYLIWAATTAWGAYFALGADDDALKNTIICGSFGAFMAWLGSILLTNAALTEALGLPIWAAIVVAATLLVLCLAANKPALGAIPASVFGYASMFAYVLQTPDILSKDVLLGIDIGNPLILVSFSIAVGAGFGKWSASLSAKLTDESAG